MSLHLDFQKADHALILLALVLLSFIVWALIILVVLMMFVLTVAAICVRRRREGQAQVTKL